MCVCGCGGAFVKTEGGRGERDIMLGTIPPRGLWSQTHFRVSPVCVCVCVQGWEPDVQMEDSQYVSAAPVEDIH